MSALKIKRISEPDAALLVIDLQEKLKPVFQNWDFLVGRCCRLIRFFDLIKAPVKVTEQYPKGLGPSVPEITAAMKDHYQGVLSKTAFSCCGTQSLKQAVLGTGRKQWILCGIETHVCVQQTAFDLLEAGCDVFIPVDAVGSRHPTDYHPALDRMKTAGAVLSTSESLMFEILKDSKHPAFKEASALVK